MRPHAPRALSFLISYVLCLSLLLQSFTSPAAGPAVVTDNMAVTAGHASSRAHSSHTNSAPCMHYHDDATVAALLPDCAQSADAGCIDLHICCPAAALLPALLTVPGDAGAMESPQHALLPVGTTTVPARKPPRI